jgi:nucleotide-binding universal stress UspA family protein
MTEYAADNDLVILGLQRLGRRRKLLGEIAVNMARDTSCALIMISRRG